ncbi:hypothetical protein Pint_34703 [Pistacia integerrima]|uniref:Uncharacterized protein n=1 Tax=Pistacia integerrima TaxID=434235 RepID=A0ACC0X3W5_9ROSI|nr:hypothetical protein Pint_34703 [Pistacia integerrima]
MGKVKGKHRLDKYYRLAKEHGYRSRASWKLVQLETKFSFLRSSHAVLDLCAAPGGWMQVAVQRVPVGSLVLGLDLVPIAPIRGAISLEQDITKPECRSRVKKVMEEHGVRAFDLVLHDGSPNVGGAWSQEAMSQNALVIDSVKLATQFLAPKGTFVTKVSSVSIPRLDGLNFKLEFTNWVEVFLGYKNGDIKSQDYSSVVYCLKQLFEKVEVDKPAASRSASAEIYVLGLRYKAPAKIDPRLLDVKHLFQGSIEPQRKVVDVLRGTKQKRHRDGYEDGESIVRKVSSAADFIWSNNPLEILGSVTSISFEDPSCLAIIDHELTTEEVKALCDDLRVLGKQDFKHLLKWRMHLRKALSLSQKDKARKATGMQVDVMQDDYIDHELFSLSSIKVRVSLLFIFFLLVRKILLLSIPLNMMMAMMRMLMWGKVKMKESRRQLKITLPVIWTLMKNAEDMMNNWKRFSIKLMKAMWPRKGEVTKHRKRAKQAYAQQDQLMEDGNDDEIGQADYDSDKDQGDHDANPLMVPLDEEEGDLGKSDSEDEMQVDRPKEKHSIPQKAKEKVAKDTAGSNNVHVQSSKAEDDFEIVPAPATDSSDDSSSDESEDEDVDTKAEILACAKKMLRKKQREQMLDDAYNKYMFDDQDLPEWFLDEERRHRQAIKPITKEEIAAMKAQFKEINARPAKKRKQIEQLYKKAAPKRPQKEYVVAKKGVQVKGGKGKVVVDRRMKKDARTRGSGKGGKGGSKKGKNAKVQKGKGSVKASAKKGKKGNRG